MYTCPDLVLLIQTIYTTIYYVTLWSWREKYPNCNCIIDGDINVDLDNVNAFLKTINNFISNRGLARCDLSFPTSTKYTYINDALNCQSTKDSFLISDR